MPARRRARQHALYRFTSIGAVIAQHDVNGRLAPPGPTTRAGAEIYAAGDRRGDVSDVGIYLQPMAARADTFQHEIVVVGFARQTKSSESRQIEVVGGLGETSALASRENFPYVMDPVDRPPFAFCSSFMLTGMDPPGMTARDA
jgi:hypothetical protein